MSIVKTFVLCLLVAATARAAPSRKPQFKRGLNKIVGGNDVEIGEVPYQLSLQEAGFAYNHHYCGGSILSEKWIVTAGHCVTGQDFNKPAHLVIIAGENDLTIYEEDLEQSVYPSRIIRHEDFNEHTLYGDIALMELRDTSLLKFNDRVQPIALPKQMQESSGDALVSGWGHTSEGGISFAHILQSVSVPILSDEDCRADYEPIVIYDSLICAGTDGKDSCQGDSGGPLVCTSGDSTYLCGIVSWGYGCARPGFPGVNTEVSYFADWIHNNTGIMV